MTNTQKATQEQVKLIVDKQIIYNVSCCVDMIFENVDSDLMEEFARFDDEIDEYEYPMEYWIVSDWLAALLAEKGEKVCDDVYGMTVWGRFTTGQSISMDRVIQDIANDLFSN